MTVKHGGNLTRFPMLTLGINQASRPPEAPGLDIQTNG